MFFKNLGITERSLNILSIKVDKVQTHGPDKNV